MAKTLKNILETYAPRSKDEKQFYNMHKVQVIKNFSEPTKDDKLFNATNIKTTSRKPDKHGYEPGEDLGKYDAGRATVPGTMKPVMGKQFAPTTTYESEEVDEAHTEKQLKQASADHTHKARVLVDTKNINDPKVLRKFHQHDKAALIAARLVGKLAGQGKSNTSQLRKEDVKAPIQTNQNEKVFKDEDNSNNQIKKKKLRKEDEQIDEAGFSNKFSPLKKANPVSGYMHIGGGKYGYSSSNPDMRINRRAGLDKDVDWENDGKAARNKQQVQLSKFTQKAVKKANQRKFGMKEDEQIDEISKTTLGSYVKKSSNSLAGLRGIGYVIKANRPNMNIDDIIKKAENRRKGINKAVDKIVKEDINEEYDSNFHYHQDQFLNHNQRAVEANKLAKHYDLNADLGMKEDPDRSAMHTGLANAYKAIATQHLKMAAHHARKSGIKSR